MGPRRSGTRIELSRLLYADGLPGDEPPKAPEEPISAQLHDLVMLGVHGTPDDARAVYEHLPLLILRFFGFSAGTGWLETGSDMSHLHREALMRVVRPDGPVIAFCAAHSPPIGSSPKPEEMRFEFPLSNLPSVTIDEIYEYTDGAASNSPGAMISALAPLLTPTLLRDVHDGQPAVLLLSPMEYFYLCMVASPSQKFTIPASMYGPGNRRPRPRRSASLPSTRAMFNHVLSDHLHVTGGSGYLLGGKSLLIPACMDYYLVPLATVANYSEMPDASTPTVDAMACVLLTLRPTTPEEFLLSSGRPSGPIDVSRDLCTASFYAVMQDVLRAVFCYFPVGPCSSLGALAAFVRLFAFYLAPWNAGLVDALKVALYAKPRPRSGSAVAGVSTPSIAAITSTLSSLNSQLPRQLQGSPTSKSSPGSPRQEAWQAANKQSSRTDVDRELVRLAVVKCSNCRLGATTEGHRALSLLADAVRAAGLDRYEGGSISNIDEFRGSLHALSDQFLEVEARSGRKGKVFVSTLGSVLGVTMDKPGMLREVAGIVGVGGAAAGVVNMMTHAAGGGTSGEKQRLRARRKHELHGADRADVPFLGGVWDMPIQGNENETAVVLAYRLALWMEPRIGFLPNVRFLGRTSFIWFSSVILVAAGVVLWLSQTYK